jgi:N-formylglutamate deformylase
VTVLVHEPRQAAVPVVASIPHGGVNFPDWARRDLACSVDELVNTDWHTPLLYDFLPELGIATLEATLNRYVVDVNRDPAIRYGDFKRAAVAAATPWGRDLYVEPPSEQDLDERIACGHTPYHGALDTLIAATREKFDHVLLLDLHSFGPPLQADVVVGDVRGKSASAEGVELVVGAFERAGFRVAVNLRFTGGWIVRRFASRPDVDALMVELHYSCYLRTDGWPRARPQLDGTHLGRAQGRLRPVVEEIVAGYAAGA